MRRVIRLITILRAIRPNSLVCCAISTPSTFFTNKWPLRTHFFFIYKKKFTRKINAAENSGDFFFFSVSPAHIPKPHRNRRVPQNFLRTDGHFFLVRTLVVTRTYVLSTQRISYTFFLGCWCSAVAERLPHLQVGRAQHPYIYKYKATRRIH